jgi:hypothetical protein
MWGVFRVEHEHLKHVAKRAPGFLEIEKNVIKQKVLVRPKPLHRIVSLLDNHIAQVDDDDDDDNNNNLNDLNNFGVELVEKNDACGKFFDEYDIESNINDIYTKIPNLEEESKLQINQLSENVDDIILETENK